MRIVELSLIKILNKQLFLAGEVKMIRLIILITTFLGLSIGSANADPKKIGFIYIGPPGDHGWTYMHDQGRQYMESQLGDAVSSTYIENVPENADAVRAIRKLAASGHDLILLHHSIIWIKHWRLLKNFLMLSSSMQLAT